MRKFQITFFCFTVLAVGHVHAQEASSYRLRQIARIVQEKLHPPVNSPFRKLTEKETSQSSGEHVISMSAPESEVDAAINPTDSNNMVVGDMELNLTGLQMPLYYTKNFGSTWVRNSFRPAPYDPQASVLGGGDPVFAYDANGKLYMTWIDLYTEGTFDTIHTGMYWAFSTNGGQTWVRPSKGYVGTGWIALNSGSQATSGIDDKEWITVDRSHSPYRNTLYVAWTHVDPGNNAVMVRRKLPGVDSMLPAVQVSSNDFKAVQYTSLGVDSKGGLHVTFMGTLDTLNYALYQVYSSDGGATFGPAVKISDADIPGTSADAVANGDVIFGIRAPGNYPCPHLSIDTAVTGNLYEVWNALGIDSDEQHGTDIYFSRSTDNGMTWSVPTVINNDTVTGYTDHFYPSIAVDGKGKISITWYDRREDPYNQIGRYYIAQSTDQGNTWTNSPVAKQPMDFNHVMDVNANFGIGEYTQVLAAPGTTIPIWTDGRDDAGNLRIYSAFLPAGNAGVERLSTISDNFSLFDNYPNPFRAQTKVGFQLTQPSHVRLFITDVAGKDIQTLLDGNAPAGENDFTFDGSSLANGVYYLNLITDSGAARVAMTHIR